jgi:hypothetical protein
VRVLSGGGNRRRRASLSSGYTCGVLTLGRVCASRAFPSSVLLSVAVVATTRPRPHTHTCIVATFKAYEYCTALVLRVCALELFIFHLLLVEADI